MTVGYQIAAAVRDVVSLRFRALLLVLQVLLTSMCVGVTINDLLRSAGNLCAAASLAGAKVSYFSLFYDDSKPPRSTETLERILTTTLDGSTSDYSTIVNNFFHESPIENPVVVALGGFAKAYQIAPVPARNEYLLIGSRVANLGIGDRVDFGASKVEVAGRLPGGQSFLDPWTGYVDLDESILFITTYAQFTAANPPAQWHEEVVGRTVLLDRDSEYIDRYVGAVADSGGLQVLPRSLEKRIGTVYQAQLGQSFLFVIFFGCLLAVMLVVLVACLNSMVVSNLRRYRIERLYGARRRHLLLRMQFFMAIVFTIPAILVFAALSILQQSLQGLLLPVVLALLIAQVMISLGAIRAIRTMSITALLRKE